ncbi:MAG: hypothetical protein ACE5IR_15635 [bacterium]
MKSFKSALEYLLIGLCLFAGAEASAQDKALQQLIQGKKFFWEAKFGQSMQALRQVVGVPYAKTEYLFEAYLYMGFVLTRQNASASEVNAAFEQAIKLDPKRKLDEVVIPPDLMESFGAIRKQLVGCLYVSAEQPDIHFLVVRRDSILYSIKAPTEICDLSSRNYQLLASKAGYEEQLLPLHFSPGKTDTMFVSLKESFVEEIRGKKKFLGWMVRGGLVAGVAAVLYMTVLENGESTLTDLPSPPDRPSQ